ncbi:MAG: methyl-accepting chemotaxis protein [Candidatus Accumulibacter sp.]|jgi:methyl-accepting chemotaxis protein|nr:methyl-accepting chemotaxis protein [Accumulibacter sp.]
MKVKHKLISLVAVALAGLVLIGGIGIYNAHEDTTVFDEIQDVRIPKIEALGAVKAGLIDLVRRSYEIIAKRGMSYDQQKKDLTRIHGQLGAALETAEKAIAEFDRHPIHPDGQAAWKRLKELWGPWSAFDKSYYAALDKVMANPTQEAIDSLFDPIVAGNMQRQEQTTEIRGLLDKLVETNKRLSREAIEATIQSSNYAMWKQVVAALVVLAILLFFAWKTLASLLGPLHQFRELLGRVATERDLTQRLNFNSTDEIGEMSVAFDETMAALQAAFQEIREKIGEVTKSAESLAATAKQIATSSQSQSSSSSAMAASMEEMAVSINTVSSSAVDAQTLAQDAGKISDEGEQIVNQASEEMTVIAQSVAEASQVIQTLGENSKEISNVVQVIREVADQTNLLALNAAIEAARAGEQGRGFAVVADEVRKLAERTAQSTGDISTMIGKIQVSATEAVEQMDKVVKQVEAGQSLTQQASKRIQEIHEETGKVSAAMTDISNALKEQGQASNDVAKHVESIAQITDENNAAAEENASNAQLLDELATNVQATIDKFKV